MPLVILVELYQAAVALLAIANLSLGIYVWTTRRVVAPRIIGGIAFAAAEVCLMFHLLTNASSPEAGYAFARLRFLGLSIINPLLFIFILQYTHLTHWLKPRYIVVLFIIPVVVQGVLWFSPLPNQFFTAWQLTFIEGQTFEQVSFGAWYYIHSYYGGVLLLLGFAVLVWYTRRVDSSRRREIYIFLAVIVVASFGVSNYVTLGPEPGLKLTPLTIGLLSLGVFWFLLSGDVRRAIPVAYDVVFNSINDAVFVLDQQELVVKVNPAAERLLRKPSAALLDQPIDGLMAHVTGWQRDMALFDITLQHSGSEALICEVRRLPMARETNILGGLLVIRDVTAQWDALAATVERERSQIISNFIADASHEFRTPLSVIKSSAYLLNRIAPSDAGVRYVAKINDHVDRINNLVNDLQVMAALDSQAAQDNEPLDMRQIVRQATNSVDAVVKARKQTLDVVIEPGLPLKQGSQAELLLAVQKVLDNAIKYTLEGGTVTLTLKPCGSDDIAIIIHDTGVGMNPETMQLAIQRFYRLDAARTTAGFGLGLPIAQKILERHGGTLTLNSTAGQGTTVTLVL